MQAVPYCSIVSFNPASGDPVDSSQDILGPLEVTVEVVDLNYLHFNILHHRMAFLVFQIQAALRDHRQLKHWKYV